MTALPSQIAIDGPAASGKSTLGRGLAQALGYSFLDTGQMYRAVTAEAIARGIQVDDSDSLGSVATGMQFSLPPDGLQVNGEPAGRALHSPQIDAYVSAVSSHASVRRALVAVQRGLAANHRIVMVGRDIGTTVLPDAPVKFWVTASEAERARRRSLERGDDLNSGEQGVAAATLGQRDLFDSTRLHSPLQKAPDAIVVDTGDRTQRQVLNDVLSLLRDAVWDHGD